jgi:hypothetical protein
LNLGPVLFGIWLVIHVSNDILLLCTIQGTHIRLYPYES